MNESDNPKRDPSAVDLSGRVGPVDEMAGAAVFLATGLSSYTHMAGGWYPYPKTGDYVLGHT